MDQAEVIAYWFDCLNRRGYDYAKKALKDAGVDKDIINSLCDVFKGNPPQFKRYPKVW